MTRTGLGGWDESAPGSNQVQAQAVGDACAAEQVIDFPLLSAIVAIFATIYAKGSASQKSLEIVEQDTICYASIAQFTLTSIG